MTGLYFQFNSQQRYFHFSFNLWRKFVKKPKTTKMFLQGIVFLAFYLLLWQCTLNEHFQCQTGNFSLLANI